MNITFKRQLVTPLLMLALLLAVLPTAAAVGASSANPSVIDITFAPADTVEIGTPLQMTVTFSDADDADTHWAFIQWGDGDCNTREDSECWVDQGTNTIHAEHTYSGADVYLVGIRIEDEEGGRKLAHYPYVVVWDPAAGYVTGNGSIQAEADDVYAQDTSLNGKKGYFGFVSRPLSDGIKGRAQYRIVDGDNVLFDFRSMSQEWLVIAEEQAIFQGGQGTIGGQRDSHGEYYTYSISVIDGKYTTDPNKTDYFRIQILDSQGKPVYDTEFGTPLSKDATTPLTSGKIYLRHTSAGMAGEGSLIVFGNPPRELMEALQGPSVPAEELNVQLFLPSIGS